MLNADAISGIVILLFVDIKLIMVSIILLSESFTESLTESLLNSSVKEI